MLGDENLQRKIDEGRERERGDIKADRKAKKQAKKLGKQNPVVKKQEDKKKSNNNDNIKLTEQNKGKVNKADGLIDNSKKKDLQVVVGKSSNQILESKTDIKGKIRKNEHQIKDKLKSNCKDADDSKENVKLIGKRLIEGSSGDGGQILDKDDATDLEDIVSELRTILSSDIYDVDEVSLKFCDLVRLKVKYFPVSDDRSWLRSLDTSLEDIVKSFANNINLPAGTSNLVKQIHSKINNLLTLSTSKTENGEAVRHELLDFVDDLINYNLVLSMQAISGMVQKKLPKQSGTVLTFGYSSLICQCLCEAVATHGFDVIVADDLRIKTGVKLMRQLHSSGIRCTYVPLTAIECATVFCDVRIVLLPAISVFANGNIEAQLGASLIALAAKQRNIPLLVACPTYRFVEKALTGTVASSKEQKQSSTTSSGAPNSKEQRSKLVPASEVLNMDFVSGIVTELRILPCSSVPAVIRAGIYKRLDY